MRRSKGPIDAVGMDRGDVFQDVTGLAVEVNAVMGQRVQFITLGKPEDNSAGLTGSMSIEAFQRRFHTRLGHKTPYLGRVA